MNRGLGAGLVLSVLVHGGAVAAIAVLGATWLMGPPPVSSPPALYVDLVYPVVATGDREESADGRTSSRPVYPSRPGGMTASRSRAPVGAARSTAAPARVPAPAIREATPAADRSGPPAVAPEVAPPPAAPVAPRAPDAPPESKPAPVSTPVPASARPVSSPPVAAAAPSLPAAPPIPTDSQPRGEPVDLAPTASPAMASTTATAVEPSSGAASVHQPSGVSTAGARARESSRPSGGITGDPGMRGAPGASSAEAPARGGEATSGDGDAVTLLSHGDGQTVSGSNGTIPPAYEPYVRALRQRIQDRLVYPWTAVRRGQQGVVELEVRLGADGRLVGVEVVAGVSADALRGAAVSAVRGSAPFPFPPGLPARPLVVRLPVEFRLR